MVYCSRKEGSAVKDRLCITERRMQLLDYLISNKRTTRYELATKFCVSTDTIDRDIVYLSRTEPILTKQGNGGGIYILPNYKGKKEYLTDAEKMLLCSVLQRLVDDTEKSILCGIIAKFSRD